MSGASRGRTAASCLLLGWGAALLVRPEATARVVCSAAAVPPSPTVRVLGARRLAQQALLLFRPSRGITVAATATDVLHALSMLAAAAIWPQYRRPALTSAGVAAASAALAVATADRAGRRPSRCP